ncbi:putative methyltransferase-domain-containing protein [Pyronema domesticum]|uniref:Similar to Uncharacterized protein C3A11.03 acc. no. O14118 n=1 Tax=Pyronema omphalodes (strain CBS 100304) TaxID=1076935 RepID=U4LKY5_PYROM|nr:putative methyltransferase-domain-containing protein [Pyronema domesticum]CCX13542.1 Similar to Uncharacterized protein C3A11.03; acc. no. O14118 [Pyronema omphalodes CBS 100304]
MNDEIATAVHILKGQYFQLIEPRIITSPPASILHRPEFQEALYDALFSPFASSYPPPPAYTRRVLKWLISAIESSGEEEVEVNSDLLELYTELLFVPNKPADPTQKSHVTYTLPGDLLPITILENPHLISGLGTTGLRTWEAALALGEWLLQNPPAPTDRILELGTGTGLVALIAARLGVKDILATDGDDGVCEGLRKTVELNGLQDVMRVEQRWWAQEAVVGADLVLGADVTYDAAVIPFLVKELADLLEENPKARVVISATIRNEETFRVMRESCEQMGLTYKETVYQRPEKTTFWYTVGTEIRIVEVGKK